MFNWLRQKKGAKRQPEYSALRLVPNRGFPAGLAGMEGTPEFDKRTKALQLELMASLDRADDRPMFVEFLSAESGGVLTIVAPDTGGQCLPVFSTPCRAWDYMRTQLRSGPAVQYLSSTPSQLVQMLRDVREGGIDTFAVDRCPRCDVFCAIQIESVKTAADIVAIWSMAKATEIARAEFCGKYAEAAGSRGELEAARDVVLEAVGHVSPDDPRLHMLLGRIAVALGDHALVREVKEFLRFLNLTTLEEKIDLASASAETDFNSLHWLGE